jgi:hypothetical protein
MGKTIKKNQSRNSARGVRSGVYVVRGKRFAVAVASADSIAEDMADRGYRAGATARWNGGEYRLSRDSFDGYSLERIA